MTNLTHTTTPLLPHTCSPAFLFSLSSLLTTLPSSFPSTPSGPFGSSNLISSSPATTTEALQSVQFMASHLRQHVLLDFGASSYPTPHPLPGLPSLYEALALPPAPALAGAQLSPPGPHVFQPTSLPPLASLFTFVPSQPHDAPRPGPQHNHQTRHQAQLPRSVQRLTLDSYTPHHGHHDGHPRAVPSVIHLRPVVDKAATGHQRRLTGGAPYVGRRPSHLPSEKHPDWVDLTQDAGRPVPPVPSKPLRREAPPASPEPGRRRSPYQERASDGDGESSSGGEDCEKRQCTHCGTRSTPEWRRGPTGRGTLCNACGLKYTKTLQQARKRKGQNSPTVGGMPLAYLLNGPEDRKRRTSLSSPMVWQTKVKNFVFSPPTAITSSPPRKRARTDSLVS